jgi:hypothetical protein
VRGVREGLLPVANPGGAQDPPHGRVAAQVPRLPPELQPGVNPTKHKFPNFTHICKIFSQICVKFLTNL